MDYHNRKSLTRLFEIMAAKSGGGDETKWLSLADHSKDAAAVLVWLYENWLPKAVREFLKSTFDREIDDKLLKKYLILLGLLHDIGKCSKEFQMNISCIIKELRSRIEGIGYKMPQKANPFRHEKAGCEILKSLGFDRDFRCIVSAHHGKPNFSNSRYEADELWKDTVLQYVNNCLDYVELSSPNDLPSANVYGQMVITGMLIMADWIASNTDYFPLADCWESFYEPGSFENKERLDSALSEISLPDVWELLELNEDFFESDFGFPPNDFQKAAVNIAKNSAQSGIYILEAPMGLGKTEAALGLAKVLMKKFGFGGLFFGLPTMSTANGIFPRIHSWAEKQANGQQLTERLAHGMTELNDQYRSMFHGKCSDNGEEELVVHDWFNGPRQALLSQIVTATVDRLLMAALQQKHVMLRHLGLAGKVVIVDECHAYDAYMNVYLDEVLKWLGKYHVPVIILSATLPPDRKKALLAAYLDENAAQIKLDCDESYPVITFTDRSQIKTVNISADQSQNKIVTINHTDSENLVPLLNAKLSRGGCCGVIVNTVSYAENLAKSLKEQTDFEIICFHSRFVATDRAEIEKLILSRVGKKSTPKDRNRLVIVGTQVLEQSLDIDFDFMVTELCPMDLLLQRSGRLHRHNRNRCEALSQPQMYILKTPDRQRTSGEMIYTRWLMERTEQLLPEKIVIPKDIPGLVARTYAAAEGTDTNSESWNEYKYKIRYKETKAKDFCFCDAKSKKSPLIKDIINDNAGNDETTASASVRDTEESIEVLVLQQAEQGKYRLLPWQGEYSFDTASGLNDEEAMLIAKQRLRLPIEIGRQYDRAKEQLLENTPSLWRKNSWIRHELLLILDEKFRCEICSVEYIYDKNYGLMLKKEVKNNEQ